MEKNIFKNAYFGKPYKTRDGRKCLFLESYEIVNYGEKSICIKCILQDELDFYFYEPDGLNFQGGYASDEDGNIEYWNTDIVSEWCEEISEEELDELAWNFADKAPMSGVTFDGWDTPLWTEDDIANAFKAGYIKALEQ